MVFGKKKTTKKKNKTTEYIDGVEQEVPDKIPELKVPIPPQEKPKKAVEPLDAQTVYDEGRSVGFQEGMIYSIQLIQDHLHRHQEELRKKISEKKGE